MIDALWSWLNGIPATIWGSLIAGGMTLIGVLVGQYALQRREEQKKEQEIESLRDSLAVELRSYDEWLEWLLYAAHDLEKMRENAYALTEEQYDEAFETELQARISVFRYAADGSPLTRDVYEANTSRIGDLDSQAAEAVVRTYGLIGRLDQHLKNLQELVTHEELAFGKDINWETGAGLSPGVIMEMEQIKELSARVLIFQKITLALLDDTGSPSDRATFAFAYTQIEPKSEDDAEMQQFLKRYMAAYDISSVEELTDPDAEHPMAAEEEEAETA